jgi:Icc-related predicted phosphoesterase
MLLGAMGDAHGGRYLRQEGLTEQLDGLDLLLLAGDITDANDLQAYGRVLDAVRKRSAVPIVAVFGNDEYEQDRTAYRSTYDITFLDDERVDLTIEGKIVRIVGTTGSLDRPTWWQRTHRPGIWEAYQERVRKVSSLLVRDGCDVLILLSHYAPTYLTLQGEKERAFPEMGSRAMEAVVLERAPDLVIHAHAHSGSPSAVLVRGQRSLDDFARRVAVPVLNVSLPLNRKVVRLEVNAGGTVDVRVRE